MPRYKVNYKGQTLFFDWNKPGKPTEEETKQIAQKLLEQQFSPSQVIGKPVKEKIEDIKSSPEVGALKWLFSPPESVEKLRKQGQERISESQGPTPSIKSGDPYLDTFSTEAQRNLASGALDLLTPTRFDIGTAALGFAAKPALKLASKALPEIEEGVKFLSQAAKEDVGSLGRMVGVGEEKLPTLVGSLDPEAGVVKFGSRGSGTSPRELGTNKRAIRAAEEKLDEIVDLVASGADKESIAEQLGIKPGTLETVFKKHKIGKQEPDIAEILANDSTLRNKTNRPTSRPTNLADLDKFEAAAEKKYGPDWRNTAPREVRLQHSELVDAANDWNSNPPIDITAQDQDITDAVNAIVEGKSHTITSPSGNVTTVSSGGKPPNVPPSGGGGNIPPVPPDEPKLPTHKYGGGREPFRFKDLKDLAGPFQRSLQSMGEFSFPFRQGRVALASHPSHIGPVFKGMFKGAIDPSYADEVVKEIYLRPFANIEEFADLGDELKPVTRNLYKEAQLGISDPSDVFPSNLAHQIPGIAQLSKRSEAAYGIGADTLRANLFDQVLKKYGFHVADEAHDWASNLPDKKTVEQLGNYVNSVTGYGRGGRAFEGAVPGLQYGFYSPRYQKSQLDMLNPVNYTGLTNRFGTIGAKEMAKDVGKFGLVTGAGLAGADYALGDKADVAWNPFDPDFAKLKIGDTRIDPLGPLASYPRFGLKITNDVLRRQFGDNYTEPTSEVFGEENIDRDIDPLWEAGKLVRQKLAPGLPSFGVDMTIGKGKNIIGQPLEDMPFSFPGLADEKHFETPYLGYGLSQTTPLYYQDLAEIDDPLAGAIGGPAGFFGLGTTTYKPREKKAKGQKNPYEAVDRLYKKLYGK